MDVEGTDDGAEDETETCSDFTGIRAGVVGVGVWDGGVEILLDSITGEEWTVSGGGT